MNTNSKEIIKSEIKQLLNLDNSNISPLEVVKKMLFSTSPEKLHSLSQYKEETQKVNLILQSLKIIENENDDFDDLSSGNLDRLAKLIDGDLEIQNPDIYNAEIPDIVSYFNVTFDEFSGEKIRDYENNIFRLNKTPQEVKLNSNQLSNKITVLETMSLFHHDNSEEYIQIEKCLFKICDDNHWVKNQNDLVAALKLNIVDSGDLLQKYHFEIPNSSFPSFEPLDDEGVIKIDDFSFDKEKREVFDLLLSKQVPKNDILKLLNSTPSDIDNKTTIKNLKWLSGLIGDSVLDTKNTSAIIYELMNSELNEESIKLLETPADLIDLCPSIHIHDAYRIFNNIIIQRTSIKDIDNIDNDSKIFDNSEDMDKEIQPSSLNMSGPLDFSSSNTLLEKNSKKRGYFSEASGRFSDWIDEKNKTSLFKKVGTSLGDLTHSIGSFVSSDLDTLSSDIGLNKIIGDKTFSSSFDKGSNWIGNKYHNTIDLIDKEKNIIGENLLIKSGILTEKKIAFGKLNHSEKYEKTQEINERKIFENIIDTPLHKMNDNTVLSLIDEIEKGSKIGKEFESMFLDLKPHISSKPDGLTQSKWDSKISVFKKNILSKTSNLVSNISNSDDKKNVLLRIFDISCDKGDSKRSQQKLDSIFSHPNLNKTLDEDYQNITNSTGINSFLSVITGRSEKEMADSLKSISKQRNKDIRTKVFGDAGAVFKANFDEYDYKNSKNFLKKKSFDDIKLSYIESQLDIFKIEVHSQNELNAGDHQAELKKAELNVASHLDKIWNEYVVDEFGDVDMAKYNAVSSLLENNTPPHKLASSIKKIDNKFKSISKNVVEKPEPLKLKQHIKTNPNPRNKSI